MNKIYDPKRQEWEALLSRPTQKLGDIEETVNTIFKAVQEKGDEALRTYTAEV